MLAKRIIPCLDVRSGRVVKGKRFKDIKDVDDPVRLGKHYCDQGADELVFYDITASSDGRKIFLDTVRNTAESINIPFMVGGGVNEIGDFTSLLGAGADKVSVNSGAVKNPTLIKEAALKFGSQCVVLSIDAKKAKDGTWRVCINGGRRETELNLLDWALMGERLGAGEIVLNCMDTDGVKQGFQTDLTRQVSDLVHIPVIASGGAGKKEDFLEVLDRGRADGALAASVFHYGEINIGELKEYLGQNGIHVRRIN